MDSTIPIKPYDTLAFGYPLESGRRITPLETEIKLSVRILLKVVFFDKTIINSVEVPKGLSYEDLQSFKEHCKLMKESSKTYRIKSVTILSEHQVRQSSRGRYELNLFIPENVFFI